MTHSAAELLGELEKLSKHIERPRTFMEIGGYPHYENVCSNFLAFFFDPEGPHKLGRLFLDTLFDSVSNEVEGKDLGGNVQVEREVVTSKGNRIDLLIKSDSYAVLIENKIFAAEDNPFDDYATYLNDLKNEDGSKYGENSKLKVLLSLRPANNINEQGFIKLAYADFARAVRHRLGNYDSMADTRYLTLMLDFLNTLENLGEETRMNPEFVELLAERKSEVEDFLTTVGEFRNELREKVKYLAELLYVDPRGSIEQIPWRPNTSLVHFLQHRIYDKGDAGSNSYVVVEPGISPKGWEIRVFYRGTPDLSRLERSHGEFEVPSEGNGPFVYREFQYEADLSIVASNVQDVLGKVSESMLGSSES